MNTGRAWGWNSPCFIRVKVTPVAATSRDGDIEESSAASSIARLSDTRCLLPWASHFSIQTNRRFCRVVAIANSKSPCHGTDARVLKLSTIGQTDREASAALQAADFLAWHTNRDVASEGGDWSARLMTFTAPCYRLHYDYDELVKTARRWRLNDGYDAVPE